MTTSAPPRSVVAAIIAGGRAERLAGQRKGTLEVGGRRIVDRQLASLGDLFARIILVANESEPWTDLGLSIIPDRLSGGIGPLAGIEAALGALAAHEKAVVCLAGDMPFLDQRALTLLRDYAPGADAVVPLVNGHAEPLFARYGRRCAIAIAAQVAAGDFKTNRLLTHVEVQWLDEGLLRGLEPHLTFLENVNTPKDLERVRALAGRYPGG